jgi:hypothetical protein
MPEVRVHHRVTPLVEAEDGIGVITRSSIPGEPRGIPGTASPTSFGRSFKRPLMSGAGTTPDRWTEDRR